MLVESGGDSFVGWIWLGGSVSLYRLVCVGASHSKWTHGQL